MAYLIGLVKKYKGLILYGIFGVLTTVINIATYALCYNYLGIANVPSDIIAWVVAVLFAFITNKLFVFDSKSMEAGVFLPELIKFMAARLATGGLDLLIMYVGVDVMHGPALILKVISNVIVIILNYVLSKLVVFRQSKA
ncbi:MAG: GtrA family protein [Clostridiales bacterium]|nr:GtrA family protein [Clostridiales bacterium]